MNKLNVAIVAAIIAAVVATILSSLVADHFPRFVGWMNFPAIAIAMLFSGDAHSPSVVAGWVAFLMWTFTYVAVFVVIYALLQELIIVRGATNSSREALAQRQRERDGAGVYGALAFVARPDPDRYLERIGSAVAELEANRRSSFLLEDMNELDLKSPPTVLGAQAVVRSSDKRAIKLLLANVEGELRNSHGSEAAEIMASVRERAKEIVAA